MFDKLRPHQIVRTIYDIDLQELKSRGIRGIITDLDNTLVGARDPVATPELVEWLDRVRQEGFQVVIVSNNNRSRVSVFAAPLQLPFIPAARKPMNKSFRKALSLMGLSSRQAVVIGDQMLTDVLGGNRMGLHTIMVLPVSPKDEGFLTRVNRTLERVAVRWMKRRGIALWEERK
ncbi:YqeG family HAD IIIA-type phosphatase [Paenibacillus thermoaerophilus]|uniref:YqeG family HAD IIIA-type phosphatase n=1 Tax=Paenibacillus thermoaerophilus TaxID=1215385 RepID=A0ABW2V168_9BACL|nr:YqeG family HAD IIIA-type phosphatase [Paenibacillus thermoaerophilus]TMV18963.1 YqeG family HAD IIIA-type phosphatase [Paenibacillus thermoaerophilus]